MGGNNTGIMGNAGPDSARYEVWELSDLIPSHDPKNQFARRGDYPATVQERPYHSDMGEQGKVLQNSRSYRPEYVLNTDPTAGNGPPIITKNGIVLGGNSRAMTLDLVYAQNPAGAAAYRTALAADAAHFGIDPAALQGMKQPVLVRVLDADLNESAMQLKSREYNQTTTQKLQQDAEAISRGRFFSAETLAQIQKGIEQEGTLNYYLSTRDTISLARQLVKDGVIQQTEYSALTLKNGQLNDQGRALVSQALRGLMAPDYDVISALPVKIAEKLDLSVGAAVALKNAGAAWDLSGAITKALKLINEAEQAGRKLETWLGQASMLPHMKDNPALQTLAMLFKNADAREVRARMEVFAHEAQKASQPSMLGATAATTPDAAFRLAFLKPVASVDGMNMTDFRPDKSPLYAAIDWAKKQGGKKATAKEALEILAKKLQNKKLTTEEKAQLKQHEAELVRFIGRIDIYKPKIGNLFDPDNIQAFDIPAAKAPEPAPAHVEPTPEPAATPEPASTPAPQQASFEPSTLQSARAAVTFLSDHQAMVRFFKSADLTSAPHEMYHIIQKQLENEAMADGAKPELRAMWQAACDFVGAKPGEKWTVEQHEKFAKAGERFLWNGATPHAQMQPILERMRERFLEVYADADAAGLEISSGMRNLFNDMLSVPLAEGEMRIQREIAEINARRWERKFYNPGDERSDALARYGADFGIEPDVIKGIMEAEEVEINSAIQTLEQSGIADYAELGRELRAELEAENAQVNKVQRFNKVMEEFAACQNIRG